MSGLAPHSPPGFDELILQLERRGYLLQKIPPNPEAVIGDPPAPVTTNPVTKRLTLRRRCVRDPNRPDLKLRWCVHPGGTPGRTTGGFNLEKVLGMSNAGYRMVRSDIKNLLIADEEINTNKALTNNNPDAVTTVCYQALGLYPEFEIFRKQSLWPIRSFIQMILKNLSDKYNTNQLELRRQEALARGEVIAPRKRQPAAPTTAKGRAALKAMKDKAAKSKASGSPSPPIIPTHTANDEGNEPGPDEHDEDNAAMDISFQQPVVLNTLEDEREDGVEDLTGDLSSMAIDPGKENEVETHGSFTLFQLASQAGSTPLPERTSESRLATTSLIPPDTRSASITPDIAPAAPRKVSRPKAALITPPDSAHPTPCLPISALPEATGPPSTAPPTSSKSSDSATKHPNAPTKTPSSTDGISAQVAKIGHLASMLGEAQRAALPQELLAVLDLFTSSAPTCASPTKGGPDDDESELSCPESASSDNPPLADQGCRQSTPLGGSNMAQNQKAPAKSGKSGPVPARTARAIKAAKAAQGVQEATEVDQLGTDAAPPPRKTAKGRTKAVAVTPDVEYEVPLRKTTRERRPVKRG